MTDAEIKQDGNAENESAQSQGQEIPSDFDKAIPAAIH